MPILEATLHKINLRKNNFEYDKSNVVDDYDGDGTCDAGDGDDDNDGAADDVDSDDNNEFVCSDDDGDTCDDCSDGSYGLDAVSYTHLTLPTKRIV